MFAASRFLSSACNNYRIFKSPRWLASISRLILICLVFFGIGISVRQAHAEAAGSIWVESFDTGITSWSVPPSTWQLGKNLLEPVWDENVGHAKAGSLRFDGQSGLHGRVYQNMPIPSDARQLCVWIKTRDMADRWVAKARVTYRNADGQFLGSQAVNTPHDQPTTEWARYTLELTPPKGATQIRLLLETARAADDAPANNRGTVWFDDLALLPSEGAVQLLALHPAGEHGLFDAGKPVALIARLLSTYSQPSKVTVRCTLTGYNGQAAGMTQQDLSLNPGVAVHHRIELPAPDRLGFFRADVTLFAASEKQSENLSEVEKNQQTSALVVLPAEQHEPDPFFGISAFRVKPFMAPTLRRLGIGTAFVMVRWNLASAPDKVDWTEPDQELAAWRKAGFRVLGFHQVHRPEDRSWASPEWISQQVRSAHNAGRDPYDAEHFEQYQQFVRQMVGRYKGELTEWHLMQEIDIPMRTDWDAPRNYYIRRVNAFAEAAREVAPEIKLTGLGVAPPDTKKGYPAARSILPEIAESLDAIWPHVYASPRILGPDRRVQIPETFLPEDLLEARALAAEYGIDELGISEWGYTLAEGQDEFSEQARQMAELTVRAIALMRSVPEVKTFCYFTAFQTHGDQEGRGGYGLWDVQGGGSYDNFRDIGPNTPMTPRPVLAAYATATRLLSHIQQATWLAMPPEVFAVLYEQEGQCVVPIWTTRDGELNLALEMPGRSHVVDMMGNTVKNLSAGKSTLTLTQAPQYLVTDHIPTDTLAQAIEQAQNDLPFVRLVGRVISKDTLAVHVQSQVGDAMDARIQVESTNPALGTIQPQTLTLAPHESKSVLFKLNPAQRHALLAGGFDCRLIATADQVDPVTQRFHAKGRAIPRVTRSVQIDGDPAEYEAMSAIDLAGMAHLRPADAKPGKLWTGDADASARVWVAWDEENLYLCARIRDEAHMQRGTPEDFWKQDSLVLALDAGRDSLPADQPDGGPDTNDYEFVIARANDSDQAQVFCVRAGEDSPFTRGVIDVPVSVRVEDDFEFFELALPWDALAPLSPRPGQAVPLSFLYADADYPDERLPYWMELSSGIHGGKDPAAFPAFILQDSPSEPQLEPNQ